MTRFGDYLGGMRRNRDGDDDAEEALLSGVDDAASSAELVAFVNALRSQANNETPRPSPELLTVLTHGRSAERLFEVHAPGGTKAQRRSEALYGARSVRQRPPLVSRRATGAFLLAGAFGAFGVAGAAGALPNGIQRATSSIVRSLTPFTVPERNRWKKPPPMIVTPTPANMGQTVPGSTETVEAPGPAPKPPPTASIGGEELRSPEKEQGHDTGGPNAPEPLPAGPTLTGPSPDGIASTLPPVVTVGGMLAPATTPPKPGTVNSGGGHATTSQGPSAPRTPSNPGDSAPERTGPATSQPGDTAPGRSNPKPTASNPNDTAPGRSNPKPTASNPSDTAPGRNNHDTSPGPVSSAGSEGTTPSVTHPPSQSTNAGQGNAKGHGPKA